MDTIILDVLETPYKRPDPLEHKPDQSTDETNVMYRGPLPDKRGEQYYVPVN